MSRKPHPESSDVSDVVVIHAYNRVEFLFPQVASFCDSQLEAECICGHGHKILFVVVDDSAKLNIEREFRAQIVRIKQFFYSKGYSNANIDYWNKSRQQRLLHKLRVGKDVTRLLFHDFSTGRLGGVRAIQNLSQLIVDSVVRPIGVYPAVLVHKLDDDIFPMVMSREVSRNGFKLRKLPQFFCQKRRFFQQHKTARIAGSYYTIDSPSQIVDLFEVVEALHIIFRAIRNADIERDYFRWHEVSSQLYFYGAPQIISLVNIPSYLQSLLNLEFIRETSSLRIMLQQLANLLTLLAKGVNRFEYNLSDFSKETKWHKLREVLPGGCISYFADESFAPFPTFASQDLLWSCREFNERGGTFGDFDIGHLKTGLGRNGFLNSIIDAAEEEARSDFAITFHAITYLKQICRAARSIPATHSTLDLFRFNAFGNNIVRRTLDRLLYIHDKISSELRPRLHRNTPLTSPLLKIEQFVSAALNGYDSIMARYFLKETHQAPSDIQTNVDSWLGMGREWERLRCFARQL